MIISLDKTIRAMSLALDLAEISTIDDIDIIEKVSNVNYARHNFLHHSLRTTYIALEIGKTLNLEKNSFEKLYLSSLIHDIGAINSLHTSHFSDEFIKSHCIQGSKILDAFPIFNDLSEIILYHHENWDGSGDMKLSGDTIPLESQIIRISDLIAVQYNDNTPAYTQKENLTDWVKINSDLLFSPKIASALLTVCNKDIFWFNLENIPHMPFILDGISPNIEIYLNLYEFEIIANIFANIIDNKSTFTARHSREIANLAYKVSKHAGYSDEKSIKMRIAGLLHDIGKLAIPSSILDKNGPLSKEEFSVIKSHAYYTKVILDRIEDIPDISSWASNHHEKLNGKGYPRSLPQSELTQESRILAVCDVFQALTEERPYRKGLSISRSFSIIDSMVDDDFLCVDAVRLLKETVHLNNI